MFNNKDIIRWQRIAKTINYKQGPDLLQDFLLKVITNDIDLNKITDAYVYTSLTNSLINTKKNKNKMKLNDYYINIDDLYSLVMENEIGYENNEIQNKLNISDSYYSSLMENQIDYENIDNEIQNKLNIISDSYYLLDDIEKKLFYIHFVIGMKLVDIAKETNLSITTIYLRIKTIKQKIKDLYDKDNQ